MKKFFLVLFFSRAGNGVGAEKLDMPAATEKVVAKEAPTAPKYCNIGADPLDPARKNYIRGDERVAPLPADAEVTMRTARGEVTCTLRAGEKIVVGSAGMWVLACGNTILKGIQAEVTPQARADNGINGLLALASRQMGTIQGVDGCGPKCRALRDQVKFNLNAGVDAGVYWHHGLKGTTVNQAQAQTQTMQAQGGRGGQGGKGGSTTITQPPVRCGGAGQPACPARVLPSTRTLPPAAPSTRTRRKGRRAENSDGRATSVRKEEKYISVRKRACAPPRLHFQGFNQLIKNLKMRTKSRVCITALAESKNHYENICKDDQGTLFRRACFGNACFRCAGRACGNAQHRPTRLRDASRKK